jgi:hypothetical protein
MQSKTHFVTCFLRGIHSVRLHWSLFTINILTWNCQYANLDVKARFGENGMGSRSYVRLRELAA